MDVLSDALLAVRTGRPVSRRNEYRGRWGLRFQSGEGIGFHVVLEGRCWFLPPGEDPVLLAPGDVVVLPHGHGHGLASGPDVEVSGSVIPLDHPEQVEDRAPESGAGKSVLLCGAYLTDRARAHPLLAELPASIHLPSAPGTRSALSTAVGLLADELRDERAGTAVVVPALLDTVLLYALRDWYDQNAAATGRGWSRALADAAVRTALDRIHGAPAHPWTVESLGKAVGLSRAAFAQRFTALTGQTPMAYLTWWRLVIAARRLRESEVSLAAIAREIGYSSEFAFANAFKRHYRVPPGRYRRDGPDDAAVWLSSEEIDSRLSSS
ncbi:AraC-like DNA-binding protein [Kribbella sp. VKM Ac-2571]|uniref:AraC family transcriptional regulator n=1 Tax=Kribbella sp. VKM Ac-2571 TaxID=2512222 RepID=UPI00105D2551|nr:AraC family transcriptional regulator [Kribbella sp. VKM Ac-2571]TDO66499.1 AraC-like DNA-binding protein [Kribbella sp. VKM Ac-2571]